jgi:3-oxoacyl-[acyl-carrier protein] reductase
MTGELAGRVVIVTGGGNGIGRAMCQEIARRGGRVAVADIDAAAASAVASEIKSSDGDAIAVTVDVSDAASADRMVDAAAEHYGRIDALVNNAAIYATVAVTRAPYDEITEREWDDMMRVNVKGTWLCSRAAARAMRAQGDGGSIVNVSSGTAFKGTPGLIHYVTSKAGILGFTRSLARELGQHQIRVNCIAPGATASTTPPGADAEEGWSPDRALPRQEIPSDVVGSVVFLLSDMSAFVTGQTLVIDGGSHLH